MTQSTATVEAMLEKAVDTYESQEMLLPLTNFHEPDGAAMQNSGNVIWQPVQQHAPSIPGWDLTDLETGIIEENYPAVLGIPDNDLIDIRADDRRDDRFWLRRAEQSGRQRATELNKAIAAAISTQGSLFFRSSSINGYGFIGNAQAIMNERQGLHTTRNFLLNDRDALAYATDLSNRDTIKGRPEEAWSKGQIGSQVAEFDVHMASFLPNLVGGADPATTVTADVSYKPESGKINPTTRVVTNIDYRTADIPVTASAGYNVGDKVKFTNTAVDVESIGLADKNSTGQAMTFTIVGKPDATTVTIFPKPIAVNDPALSTLEKAYANINTRILDTAVMSRLNIDANKKTNLFFDQDAVEVIGGNIPANKFADFGGMKVITDTMKNGLTMYLLYDGDITKATFRFRIFVWYGITICDPSRCGVGIRFSA